MHRVPKRVNGFYAKKQVHTGPHVERSIKGCCAIALGSSQSWSTIQEEKKNYRAIPRKSIKLQIVHTPEEYTLRRPVRAESIADPLRIR
jgi:hypothetical protein